MHACCSDANHVLPALQTCFQISKYGVRMILVSSNAQNPTFSLRAIKDSEKLCSSFGGHLKIVNNTSRRRKERDLTSYPYLKAYEPSHS
jgi:hypothetical protein